MIASMLKNVYTIIFVPFFHWIKLLKHKFKWRKINKHNKTYSKSLFPIKLVSVGNYTYGSLDIKYFGNSNEKVNIGNFCSIADNVKFIAGGGHDYKHLSTYPFKRYICKQNIIEATTKGTITVCDDVWIGYGTLILSGVKIGQGAVIGAGSIVAKDIPPYAIYVGSEVIKYRFEKEVIDCLIKFNYKKIDGNNIKENIDLLYHEINEGFFDSEFWKNYSDK